MAAGGEATLCPVGWTLHRSKCFWVASKSSSWRESRENCSGQSAQLLVPEDQGELVTGPTPAGTWDGAQDCTRGAGGTRRHPEIWGLRP
uniref:Uncharacterized protein n=1 Tax=Anser cygnoides TaxID=8845 RepID=A0A8B9E2E9_ANSCY